jgi:hypothetical protein
LNDEFLSASIARMIFQKTKHIITSVSLFLLFIHSGSSSFIDAPVHLSRPGSRFTIVPEYHNQRIRVLPMGYSIPEESGFTVTVDSPGGISHFPSDFETLSISEKRLTPTSAEFTIPVSGANAFLRYEIVSPFTPVFTEWRIAPIMFITVTLVNNDSDTVTCDVSLNGLRSLQHNIEHKDGTALFSAPWNKTVSLYEFASNVKGVFMAGGYKKDGWRAEMVADEARLTVTISAEPDESQYRHAVILFHTASPVLEVDKRLCRFAYLRDFPNPGYLMKQALYNRDRLLKEDLRMRSTMITDTSTDPYIALTHSALQSFLACSWLVRSPDGALRYSEWEGFPLFHSTMDVVYNTSLFHLAYAPDFLANMLQHWPRYHLNGDMPHDMGKGLIIGENAYKVVMLTEENANFLLLHSMYAAQTGDVSLAKLQKPVLERVIQRLIEMDTDGNGLPNLGAINSFDDAPRSINIAENQIYLGIKKATALQAVSTLFKGFLSDAIRAEALARADTIYQSIIDSWTGTHFPIALPSETDEKDARVVSQVLLPHDSDHPIRSDDSLEDLLDGFSNYAAHGLVALWLSGLNAPPELEALMKKHLEIAHQKTATEYGDAHRDGVDNVWVSQNMWRDLAALYLDADIEFDLLHQRYLRLQKEAVPRRDGTGRWEGFCDSPVNSFLTAYSRGIPILGFHWFAPGKATIPEIRHP